MHVEGLSLTVVNEETLSARLSIALSNSNCKEIDSFTILTMRLDNRSCSCRSTSTDLTNLTIHSDKVTTKCPFSPSSVSIPNGHLSSIIL